LAAIDQRPVVVDRNVGNANALRDYGVLALQRQIEHHGLGMAETRYRQKARKQGE
jgi:hypothetical protein